MRHVVADAPQVEQLEEQLVQTPLTLTNWLVWLTADVLVFTVVLAALTVSVVLHICVHTLVSESLK